MRRMSDAVDSSAPLTRSGESLLQPQLQSTLYGAWRIDCRICGKESSQPAGKLKQTSMPRQRDQPTIIILKKLFEGTGAASSKRQLISQSLSQSGLTVAFSHHSGKANKKVL